MNQDIELGKTLAKENKAFTLREFVYQWEHRIDYDRFDSEDGQSHMLDAILLSAYGYASAGGVMNVDGALDDEE